MSRSNHVPKETIRDTNTRLPFGKYRGERIKDVMQSDPQYLLWLRDNTEIDFHSEIMEAIEGKHRPVDWYDIYQLQDKGLIPK